jgi:hypothetical protein
MKCVETISGMEEGEIEDNDGGSEYKYYIL